MDRLWTPWRMEYILSEKSEGCIFCDMLAAGDDRACLILHRGQRAFVVLNRYPYNNGHLMVVPYAHASTLEGLDDETLLELMQLVNQSLAALRKTMSPHGFNIGVNLGKPAGAGVADHVHIHVVPRWEGDTNFMAVLAGTRMVPEMLDQTCDRLTAAFAEVEGYRFEDEEHE
ncbi:MAG: HIT domain-containing protein [Anaerolineae bacterium]|nr:HIT domain-containing protein [Anaerolineae bacterium]